MELCSIASGSSGNCICVGTQESHLLVDAGISGKRIETGLNSVGLKTSEMEAILITHEHIDHVKGLGVISRSLNIPIYATRDTCNEICRMDALGDFNYGLLNPIEPDKSFQIGDISIEPHSIWHDAADPVCYSLMHKGKKVSIATDLVGPYPYILKQRILGKRGHLSNEAGGRLIRSLLNDHIKKIILGHLSDKNNYPELAYEAVKNELSGNEYADDVREFNLTVAGRNTPGELVCL